MNESPPPRSPRWWAFDVLVLLLALPVLTFAAVDTPAPAVWFTISAQLVRALPFLVRCIWPERVFWWVWLCTAGRLVSDVRLAGSAAAFIAVCTAAGIDRRRVILCACALEPAEIGAAIRTQGSGWWSYTITSAGLVLAAVSLGLYRATRRTYLAELVDRAARLEREHAQTHELAVINERAGISRELHDIVAHHLTVVVGLSDAASLAAGKDPDPDRDRAGDVRRGRRRPLGAGRQPPTVGRRRHQTARRPQPLTALDDLGALIDNVRAIGLPLRFQTTGSPPKLLAVLELTLYRLVQESLTNTIKHGGAGPGPMSDCATFSMYCN